jgi:hypothetical protein
MADSTPLSPCVIPPRTEHGKFKTTLDGWNGGSHDLMSSFAWIPAIFAVSDDGRSVHIDGYINGLGSREQHPLLYDILEQTFLVIMPLLEKTMAHHFVVEPTLARECGNDGAYSGLTHYGYARLAVEGAQTRSKLPYPGRVG